MTIRALYTVLMKYSILIATPFWGIFWLVILFIFCFLFVHTARLARLGLKYRAEKNTQNTDEKKPDTPTEKKEAPAPQTQEPIYYIVERKKKARASYSEPKQIRFKE